MTDYSWTTKKGVKVEITVELREVERTLADGWIKETTTVKVITRLAINGKDLKGSFTNYQGRDAIETRISNKRAIVMLPEKIAEAIFGEERRAKKERLERELAAEQEYLESYNKVLRTMEGK